MTQEQTRARANAQIRSALATYKTVPTKIAAVKSIQHYHEAMLSAAKIIQAELEEELDATNP